VHAAAAAALVAVQAAVTKAGSLDKAKVRAALASLKLDTFYGPIEFGANGMNSARSLPIIQVQGGKVVVLSPEPMRQGRLLPVR
jgi:branched-chain amino acid transport system substrate-binding protein